MHNSAKNWTGMKILPKSKRTIVLLKPFYKPYVYIYTHTHKSVFHPPLRGNRAWGGTQQPFGSPSFGQCAGSQGTRSLPGRSRGAVPSAGDARLPLRQLSPSGKGWRQECSLKQKPTYCTPMRYKKPRLAKVSTNISSNNPI